MIADRNLTSAPVRAARAPYGSPVSIDTCRARLVAMLVAAALVCVAPLSAQDDGARVGTKAPVVMVNDLAGTPTRVGHVAGKRAAVIEFWATWCDLCKELLPRVRVAQQKYGDRVDFYGVNVTVNESKARVQRYVTSEHPPWVTLYDDKGVAVRAFKAPATSYVVIVDRDGLIRYVGSGGTQDLSAELAKVVGK
ncbi:MAG: TlpA disulfide reductase family protein [Gemmatimonadota bacterium]